MRPITPFLLASLLMAAPALAQTSMPGPVPPTTPATGMPDSPSVLLRQAQGSLAAGRLPQALEFVEQAETRVLTRSVLATEAEAPARSAAITAMAGARSALARRDRATAGAQLTAAITAVEAPVPAPSFAPAVTPAPDPAAPWTGNAPATPVR